VLGDGSRYDDEFFIPSWGAGVAGVDAGPYDALVVNDARVLGRSGRQRDPNDAAAREFVRLLRDRGVAVAGGWSTGVADPGLGVIASVDSQPLGAVLAEMLTTSDNDTAEMLLKELGFDDAGTGTVAAGLDVVDRTLRTWGIPMDGVRLVDASGLSTDNRLTCGAILALLARVEGGPVAAGLPVAGRTGTLADQFVGTPMDGRMVAKTGTLGNPPADLDPPAVKSLAGYLEAPDGSTIEFVMILNGPDISNPDNYGSYWIALSDRLASYPNGPDPSTVGPR
jgi:D-alanyl-D-alanine carboxypeptidase/D-alanyl-D-alanine-endopeptidase (penicillin-binding protein 4)